MNRNLTTKVSLISVWSALGLTYLGCGTNPPSKTVDLSNAPVKTATVIDDSNSLPAIKNAEQNPTETPVGTISPNSEDIIVPTPTSTEANNTGTPQTNLPTPSVSPTNNIPEVTPFPEITLTTLPTITNTPTPIPTATASWKLIEQIDFTPLLAQSISIDNSNKLWYVTKTTGRIFVSINQVTSNLFNAFVNYTKNIDNGIKIFVKKHASPIHINLSRYLYLGNYLSETDNTINSWSTMCAGYPVTYMDIALYKNYLVTLPTSNIIQFSQFNNIETINDTCNTEANWKSFTSVGLPTYFTHIEASDNLGVFGMHSGDKYLTYIDIENKENKPETPIIFLNSDTGTTKFLYNNLSIKVKDIAVYDKNNTTSIMWLLDEQGCVYYNSFTAPFAFSGNYNFTKYSTCIPNAVQIKLSTFGENGTPFVRTNHVLTNEGKIYIGN